VRRVDSEHVGAEGREIAGGHRPAMTRVRSSTRSPLAGRSAGPRRRGAAPSTAALAISGCPATARPCGCSRHCSTVRTAAVHQQAGLAAHRGGHVRRVESGPDRSQPAALLVQPGRCRQGGPDARDRGVCHRQPRSQIRRRAGHLDYHRRAAKTANRLGQQPPPAPRSPRNHCGAGHHDPRQRTGRRRPGCADAGAILNEVPRGGLGTYGGPRGWSSAVPEVSPLVSRLPQQPVDHPDGCGHRGQEPCPLVG
jgi:hypothetical protein